MYAKESVRVTARKYENKKITHPDELFIEVALGCVIFLYF